MISDTKLSRWRSRNGDGESSDRKFLGLIVYRLKAWFPYLPDQSQYNWRLGRLTPQIEATQLAEPRSSRRAYPAGRWDSGQLRELSRLRFEKPLRARFLRLLPLAQPVRLADVPHRGERSQGGSGGL
jgi:hypothetical protein